MKLNISLILIMTLGFATAEPTPLTFAEKTKIKKMTSVLCEFDKFNDYKNVKQKTATFKVCACKKTIKELGLITTANCKVSGNPDGYVCSLMSLSDAIPMDAIDFVSANTFFVYSKSKSKLDQIKSLSTKGTDQYFEFYVMVEKDKDLKTLFRHSWKDVIYAKSGESPAFWIVDSMPVERFELDKKVEPKVITGRTLKAIKVEKDKTARYKVKCKAELSTLYFGSFDGYKEKFYAIELYDGTATVYSYIRKDNKGKKVFAALADSANKKAEVEIHYKQNELLDDVFCLDEITFSKQ